MFDRADLDRLCQLSRLKLSEEEAVQILGDLERMLEHVEALRRVDTAEVDPLVHDPDTPSSMREDSTGPSLDREIVLALAPESRDRHFSVPIVVSTGSGEDR